MARCFAGAAKQRPGLPPDQGRVAARPSKRGPVAGTHGSGEAVDPVVAGYAPDYAREIGSPAPSDGIMWRPGVDHGQKQEPRAATQEQNVRD
jgi:hypothetical protein